MKVLKRQHFEIPCSLLELAWHLYNLLFSSLFQRARTSRSWSRKFSLTKRQRQTMKYYSSGIQFHSIEPIFINITFDMIKILHILNIAFFMDCMVEFSFLSLSLFTARIIYSRVAILNTYWPSSKPSNDSYFIFLILLALSFPP